MPDTLPIPPIGTSSFGSEPASLFASEGSNAKTADYDAFLKLLVVQLQNQDPTDPADPGEFIAQLASFSSVEQQIKVNENLSKVLAANLIGEAGNLIGLRVTSSDGNTSGIVTAVTIGEEFLTAKLHDGSELQINSGVVIE